MGNPGITTGRANGQLVATIPIPVDKPLLALGQKKYNIVCSQCHGVLGDGNSIVAENMAPAAAAVAAGAVRQAGRPLLQRHHPGLRRDAVLQR